MRTFHLTIAKVGENLFDGEAVSVALLGEDGAFEVLAGHEALIAPLAAGRVRVEAASGKHHHFEVPSGGIVEVSGDQATILL